MSDLPLGLSALQNQSSTTWTPASGADRSSRSHDAPKPYVPEGHLLLDVYCTALNFFEILQAQGRYQNKLPLPFTLGAEFSGVVAADSPIPPGCEFKRGDRVFGHAQGAYAEQVAANPKGLLIKVPDGLSMEHAAAVPL